MKFAHLLALKNEGEVELGTLALDRGKVIIIKDSIASQNLLEESQQQDDVEEWFNNLSREYHGSYFVVAIDDKVGSLPQGG